MLIRNAGSHQITPKKPVPNVKANRITIEVIRCQLHLPNSPMNIITPSRAKIPNKLLPHNSPFHN